MRVIVSGMGVMNVVPLYRSQRRSPLGRQRWLTLAGIALFAGLALLAARAEASGSNTIADPNKTGGAGPYTSLVLDSAGNPMASYHGTTEGDLYVLHCNDPRCYFDDDARTSPDTTGDTGEWTSVAVDSADNPVVAYQRVTGGELSVLHCGNSDCTAGNTITYPDLVDDSDTHISLVLDAAGNPVISWYGGLSADLRILHCGNPACSAGNTETTPDTGGSVGQWTSLTLDAAGNPVVSYYSVTTGDLRVLHCDDPSCTGSGDVIANPDTAGDVGRSTSIELNAAGNPVVSYYDMTNLDLKVLTCGDANCSAGNVVTTPDSTGDVGADTSLEIDGAGNPAVSYYDQTNGDLKVLRCGDKTCASGNTITSPDTQGTVGAYSALALDALGYPVVAYADETNNNAQVLHCANPTCSTGNAIVNVDEGGINFTVGIYATMVLDASDRPVMAYEASNNGNEDLRIARCGNATCTSGNTVTTPDAANDTGYWPSIALDSNSFPVVSYSDYTNQDLKVLHCGDMSCTAGNVISTPESAGATGSWTSLELDAAGNPVVSYVGYSGATPQLRVLHCGNPNCTAGNVIATPDTIQIGSTTSLELDAAGNPVVSYHGFDGALDYLKVLHCGNPTCTSGNVIAEPDASVSAYLSSLVLDASGRPVIAYTEISADYADINLAVLHCGDATCSTGNSIAAPDAEAGYGPSIALDAAGNPLVSYRDALNADLRVLTCGNPNCTAGNSISLPDTAGTVGIWSSIAANGSGIPVIGYFASTSPSNVRVLFCYDCDYDTDNDLCTDDAEQQTTGGSELSGGRRNFKNRWDYFNPTQDGINRVDDILEVVDQYFIDKGTAGYTQLTDRTLLGPNAWDTGPPNGLQRVDDILNAVHQYFHDCA